MRARIAAGTEPRFIEIKPEPRRKSVRGGFIEMARQRRGGRLPFTEAELSAMRGGLTAEEYRREFIREFGVE